MVSQGAVRAATYQAIAENLFSSYATRICEAIRNAVKNDCGLPEAELEHPFKVLLAFDSENLELPDYVRALKIEVVKRLIDRYYEGYPAEDKQKVLEQLAGIEGRNSP
jgi:hypothetical protein